MRFALLAPSRSQVPEDFSHVEVSRSRHERLLSEMQVLRGKIYLADGAIRAEQLSQDGRHRMAVDDQSWHLLGLDERGRVCGCMRYLSHEDATTFDDLTVRHAALACSDQWAGRLRAAVENELAVARRRGVPYIEVGGWAIAPERRRTADALRFALAGFGIGRLMGGSVGITTATTRHCSSTILRRIGGRSLEYGGELPSYYDAQYGCEMEILRFDSCSADSRFEAMIEQLQFALLDVPVTCARRSAATGMAIDADLFDLAPVMPAWLPVSEAL
jgi:hypothetical protein